VTRQSHLNKGNIGMNNISDINVLSIHIEYLNKNGIQINGVSNINNNLSCHYLIYRIDNLINNKYYIG